MRTRTKESRRGRRKKTIPLKNDSIFPTSSGSDDAKICKILEDISTSEESMSGQSKSFYVRPPISYACLIREALCSSPERQLVLSEIYEYIQNKYPYFQKASPGWKNSIRHNLSLNRSFSKSSAPCSERKGSLWKLVDAQIPVDISRRQIIPFFQNPSKQCGDNYQEKFHPIFPKKTILEPHHNHAPTNILLISSTENPAFRKDVFLGAKTPELAREISTPEILPNTRSSFR